MSTGTRHALDAYLDVEARRHALALEEEGLAYLLPVDRILAIAGGLVGGTVTAGIIAGALLTGRRIRWPRR